MITVRFELRKEGVLVAISEMYNPPLWWVIKRWFKFNKENKICKKVIKPV